MYSGGCEIRASLCVLIKPSMSNANGCAPRLNDTFSPVTLCRPTVGWTRLLISEKAMPKCVPFLVKKISRRSVSSP